MHKVVVTSVYPIYPSQVSRRKLSEWKEQIKDEYRGQGVVRGSHQSIGEHERYNPFGTLEKYKAGRK